MSRLDPTNPDVFSKAKMTDSDVLGLSRNWDFVASETPWWRKCEVIKRIMFDTKRSPGREEIVPVKAKSDWSIYFIYAPTGVLTKAHLFSLGRLKDSGIALCVIIATKERSNVPGELLAYADALYWKALDGFDFSAYRLGMHVISQKSENANIFVMNDSVLGPFVDIKSLMAGAKWDLTGFTASSELENHIQSYAFVLKHVNRQKMRGLNSVLFPVVSLNNMRHVVRIQETRFARVASRQMSVGAHWFGNVETSGNPSLYKSKELVSAGFPFLKKSLFGINAHLMPQEELLQILSSQGHPY
jgi:lipopolysaccharide biosynthesis protein